MVTEQTRYVIYGSLLWETLIVMGWKTRSINENGIALMVRNRAPKLLGHLWP